MGHLISHLKQVGHDLNIISYKDHHQYNKNDIEDILLKFNEDKQSNDNKQFFSKNQNSKFNNKNNIND